MMWVRWTLPRLRIDQVMTTCLKYCTPIAAVMFIGATLWTYYLPGGLFLSPSTPLGQVREGWTEARSAAGVAMQSVESASLAVARPDAPPSQRER
jgi:NADH-quinone oxidoreductase subunit H